MNGWRRLRGFRLDLFLVVAAIAMVAVVIWDRGQVTTREAQKRHHSVLDAWRVDDVTRLVFTSSSGPDVTLTAEMDGVVRHWRLTVAGRDVAADEAAVSQLLVALDRAGYVRRAADDGADLGLSPPSSTLAVEMPPLSYRLELGGPAPAPEGARYLRVSGGGLGTEVYVVDDRVAKALAADASRYRRRQLNPFDPAALKAVALESRDANVKAGFRLERGEWGGRVAGDFVLDGPPKIRVERRTFEGWLSILQRLEAARFLDETVQSPRATLTLTPAEGPPATLRIGGPCPAPEGTVKVQREGVEPATVCVAADLMARLLLDASELEDPFVLGTPPTDVVSLVFEGPEVTLDLARKGQGWHMRKPEDTTPDPDAVADLLQQLVEARGARVDIADGAAEDFGLAEPRGRLVVEGLPAEAGGNDTRREVIAVGTERDDGIYLRREDDGTVLRVPLETGRAFLPRPSILRSLQIFDVAVTDIETMDLSCGKPQQLRRQPSGTWILERPDDLGVRADVGQAVQYVDRLRRLKAMRWVAETPADVHALAEPWCRVTIGAGRSEPLTLRLGAETPDGYFAQREAGGPVFVVGRGMGNLARQWMFERTSLLVDVAEVARARVRRGDRTLEVTVDDGAWEAEPPTLGPLLRDTLDDLIAEGAVTAGAPRPAQGLEDPQLTIELWRAHADEPIVLRIGRGDVWRDTSVFYARRDGVSATFAVAQSRLRRLLDAL